MTPRFKLFSSSVGTKLAIGLTGLALFVYLLLHLAGNILFFLGAATFNEYSGMLLRNPLIVPIELALLLIFLVHAYKTVRNWAKNRQARPVAYQEKHWAGHTSRKSVASTTMIVSGVVILAFLILHLQNFKFGAEYQVPGSNVRDLYRLEVETFQEPAYVAIYVACMVLVGLHLRHGVSSAFQSLGVDHPAYAKRLCTAGTVLAIIVGGGFAAIPILVYLLGGRR